MIHEIVLATNNNHKLEEIRKIVPQWIKIISLSDIGCTDEIVESEDTLEGNALLKARYIKNKYGYDCIADDSGLEIAALNNAPGVYSARYAGEPSDAKKNVQKVLCELENCELRNARFRTVLAYIHGEQENYFEGIIEGTIIREERGTSGFGYDPIFVPNNYTLTFAEMESDVKNKISHRSLAVNNWLNFLRQNNE